MYLLWKEPAEKLSKSPFHGGESLGMGDSIPTHTHRSGDTERHVLAAEMKSGTLTLALASIVAHLSVQKVGVQTWGPHGGGIAPPL